jgi:hypothetical protein
MGNGGYGCGIGQYPVGLPEGIPVGPPVPTGKPDEPPLAVMGDTGEADVPVPGAEEVSLPLRDALGAEYVGEVPMDDVTSDPVIGDTGELPDGETVIKVVPDNVEVSVSGIVIVVPPVLKGAVGAVFGAVVSLHGVGKAGKDDDSEPVTGLTSVDDESAPDETGKYPYGGKIPVGRELVGTESVMGRMVRDGPDSVEFKVTV